ncbi:MAG: hypothetical protein EPN86_01405 [Nanoarchaeota archaeon]|nr:MAG: hypothetical protein EPN86_01405 [Nanoarchaeota archaeon]
MRKTIVLLLAALMIMGSVALAEDNGIGANIGTAVSVGTGGNEGSGNAEANAKAGVGLRGKLLNLKEKVENKKESLQDLGEKYLIAKDNYLEARKDLVKLGIWGFGKINLTEEQKVQISSKFVLAAGNRIDAQLLRLKAIADNNNRTDVSAEIQGYLDQDAKIEADVNSSTTYAEVKQYAADLRDVWKNAQELVARRHGLIFVEKVRNTIQRIENAANKIDSKLEQMNQTGYNVTLAQAKINETLTFTGEAKQKAIQAEAEFSLVNGTPGQDEHFKNGMTLLKDANDLLRKAYDDLNSILKDARKYVVEERKEKRNEKKEDREGEGNKSGSINETVEVNESEGNKSGKNSSEANNQ